MENGGRLTKEQCSAMKGLAIIGIMLHNYSHWLGPVVKENEFSYSQGNVDGLLASLAAPDALLPLHLMSFFGHYGVPVFLFLSGFGLVVKYELEGRGAGGAWGFVKGHWVKLFKMMAIGFAIFTAVDAVTPGRHHYGFADVAMQLAMVNNFAAEPDKVVWPGPYWFFCLMVQFYVLYRLVFHGRKSLLVVAFTIVCMGLQAAAACDTGLLVRLRYNFVGEMLPFALGMLYARHGFPRVSRSTAAAVAAAMAAAVAAMGCSFATWLAAPAAVCVSAAALVMALPPRSLAPLVWTGGISAALFVVHPVTRKIFIPISRQGDYYTGLLLYAVASIVAAYLYHSAERGKGR